MDDRATSVVVNYVTALGVIALLVVTLFVGLSGFVDAEHERTVRSELEVVGNHVATDLGVADRLTRSATNAESVTIRTDLPDRAAGARYKIEISDEGSGLHSVTLRSSDPDVVVSVGVRLETTVSETTVDGGDLQIQYRSDSVVVTNA